MPCKWDIVFLITGKPLPAMLDMAFYAEKSGLRTLMIIMERGHDDLIIDQALVNFAIETIHVPYQAVDWKRVRSLPSIYRRLRDLIRPHLRTDGILVTSSYDLLVFGRLLAIGRRYHIRHQVRDLHRLQLSKSPLSRVLVAIERILMRRVETLIVSSPEFVNRYYGQIHNGKAILLENVPAEDTWAEYRRTDDHDGFFRIGFVGIMRYRRSLSQLIAATQSLVAEGLPIKVVFAGGGSIDDLIRDHEGPHEVFEVSGSYEYTKDITRLYRNIDLVYAVYDSEDLNCQLAMPNKFYEAIIANIPILVASGTFVEKEVLRLGIGRSVLTGDVEALENLFREAVALTGWYSEATSRLRETNASHLWETYREALSESVLP